jgi:hypothetical protein
MGRTKPYRPLVDQRLDPPPALPEPDALDRTAQQVRIDRAGHATVHRLTRAWTTLGGRTYRTRCTTTLTAAQGAILTTHKATCEDCARGAA